MGKQLRDRRGFLHSSSGWKINFPFLPSLLQSPAPLTLARTDLPKAVLLILVGLRTAQGLCTLLKSKRSKRERQIRQFLQLSQLPWLLFYLMGLKKKKTECTFIFYFLEHE